MVSKWVRPKKTASLFCLRGYGQAFLSNDAPNDTQAIYDKIDTTRSVGDSGPRAVFLTLCLLREVKQSWLSTVVSTARAIFHAIPIVFDVRPDLLLVNGPGTCIPIILASLLLQITTNHDVKLGKNAYAIAYYIVLGYIFCM